MQKAIEFGIIDISYVQEMIKMNKRKELLEKHPYKIWESKNGKWYTYLYDQEKKRKLIKRNTQSDLENTIIQYYEENNK